MPSDPLLAQAMVVAAGRYRDVAREGNNHDQALVAALDAFLDVLRDAGRLLEPATGPRIPTDEEYDELARWLAGQSRHPRYVEDPDGWRQLLASEHNIEHAFAAAKNFAGSPAEGASLAAARTALVDRLKRQART